MNVNFMKDSGALFASMGLHGHRPLTCSFDNLPFGATLVESFKAMIDIMDIVHVTLATQIIVGTI